MDIEFPCSFEWSSNEKREMRCGIQNDFGVETIAQASDDTCPCHGVIDAVHAIHIYKTGGYIQSNRRIIQTTNCIFTKYWKIALAIKKNLTFFRSCYENCSIEISKNPLLHSNDVNVNVIHCVMRWKPYNAPIYLDNLISIKRWNIWMNFLQLAELKYTWCALFGVAADCPLSKKSLPSEFEVTEPSFHSAIMNISLIKCANMIDALFRRWGIRIINTIEWRGSRWSEMTICRLSCVLIFSRLLSMLVVNECSLTIKC